MTNRNLFNMKALFEAAPIGCILFNGEGEIFDCNARILERFGFSGKKEFIQEFYHYMPKYQEHQKKQVKSYDFLQQKIVEAKNKGSVVFDWLHQYPNGDKIPFEITMVRILGSDGEIIIGAYARDINIVHKEKEMRLIAEKRLRLMIDSAPLLCNIWEESGNILDCNQTTLDMLGAESKSEFITNNAKYHPKHQSDGMLSLDKRNRLFEKLKTEKQIDTLWDYRRSDGKIIPTRLTLIRAEWDDGYRILGYGNDISDIVKAGTELRRKTELLGIVNNIAEWLLPTNPMRVGEEIYKSMEYLGQAVDVATIKLWKNEEIDGKPYFGLTKCWPEAGESEYSKRYAYEDFPLLWEAMCNKRTLNGSIDCLPSRETRRFKMTGVQVVLNIPLFVGTVGFWGHILFERKENANVFTDDEVQALQSASILLASSFHRNTAETKLIEANRELLIIRRLLTAVNSVAELILMNTSMGIEEVLKRSLELIGLGVHADQASFWEVEYEKDEEVFAIRKSSWVRDGIRESALGDLFRTDLAKSVPQWSRAEDIKEVTLSYHEMSKRLKDALDYEKSARITLIPMFIQNKLGAFISIKHQSRDYHISAEEMVIIKSGGLMMLEAVNRTKMTDDLEKIGTLAATDLLTGLMNRTSFIPRAETVIELAALNKDTVAVMFLDIDFFKKVNDNFGHDFGDEVLKGLADALTHSLRPTDLCARYGGEEFVVLLTRLQPRAVSLIANRIMDAIKGIVFPQNPAFTFTVSIGITSRVPNSGQSLKDFLKLADTALYEAKNTGRNKIVYHEEMDKGENSLL